MTPQRLRTVLWHAEIIGETTAGIGSLLNLEPEAATALPDDAPDGLRAAYGPPLIRQPNAFTHNHTFTRKPTDDALSGSTSGTTTP